MQSIIGESRSEQLENITLYNRIQIVESTPIQEAMLCGDLYCHQYHVLAKIPTLNQQYFVQPVLAQHSKYYSNEMHPILAIFLLSISLNIDH